MGHLRLKHADITKAARFRQDEVLRRRSEEAACRGAKKKAGLRHRSRGRSGRRNQCRSHLERGTGAAREGLHEDHECRGRRVIQEPASTYSQPRSQRPFAHPSSAKESKGDIRRQAVLTGRCRHGTDKRRGARSRSDRPRMRVRTDCAGEVSKGQTVTISTRLRGRRCRQGVVKMMKPCYDSTRLQSLVRDRAAGQV